ncbi:MAG: DUF2520 domain-containing protein [Bacteroidaceae bacterium]|nr:DUF2520 domain-containing protein [Bacteroidaceae bacterium]
MSPLSIVIIGAGNVAHHIAKACVAAQHKVVAVHSRTIENARSLAATLGESCQVVANISCLPNADLYIIAVSDSAISRVVQSWPTHCREGIVVHTAGSIGLEQLRTLPTQIGVVYPLQTFSASRELDFRNIPIFIEGDSVETTQTLEHFAKTISDKVVWADSPTREQMHLAAVFACNFVNHLYAVAAKILNDAGIDSTCLEPLILETASKATELPPIEAQTGPAKRGDQLVMDHHKALLASQPELCQLYDLLSKNIQQLHNYDKL